MNLCVLCWPWANSVYVYIVWIWHAILVIDIVWGRNFTRVYTTMAVLRWSSFVEYMKRSVLSLDKQRVRLYCCVYTRIRRCYWLSIQREFIITCCSNTLQWRWLICVDLCSLNVSNGCHLGPGRTECTFALLCGCLNLKSLLLLHTVWDCNRDIQIHTTMTMMTDLSCSSFVECMERVMCWSWTNKTWVCIDVLLVFDIVWGRNITLVYTRVWV